MTAFPAWISVATFIFDHAMEQGAMSDIEGVDELSFMIRQGDPDSVGRFLTKFVNEELEFVASDFDSEAFLVITGIYHALDTSPYHESIQPILRAMRIVGYDYKEADLIVRSLLGRA